MTDSVRLHYSSSHGLCDVENSAGNTLIIFNKLLTEIIQ